MLINSTNQRLAVGQHVQMYDQGAILVQPPFNEAALKQVWIKCGADVEQVWKMCGAVVAMYDAFLTHT